MADMASERAAGTEAGRNSVTGAAEGPARAFDMLGQVGDAPVAERARHLSALAREVKAAAEDLAAAVDADFGGRPRAETMLAEIGMTLENIRWTKSRLRRWARPERVVLSPEFWPSRARVDRVPLGIVGILSPWNYPVQLALVPLVAALAGGNRVILKPSEHTPRTAALLREILHRAVGDRVRVVEGGADVAAAVTSLPLDGIFYTGSTEIGRKVLAAAAPNLVPTTLELGGKSPAIVLPDADLARTARSVMAGKLINAGQTCVAPDYVLAPRAIIPGLTEALKTATAELYPDPENGDYAAILRPDDRARLEGLLEGEDVVPLMARMPAPPRMGAYAVVDPDPQGALMRDEIFGPVLPIVPCETPEEAAEFVRARPSPLALYVFGKDLAMCERILASVPSGGAMINDCLLHVAAHALPFGGTGASGMGSYHGQEGFRTFTRPRSVLTRARYAAIDMSRPPYGKAIERVIGFLLR